jgi:hypothetical protein
MANGTACAERTRTRNGARPFFLFVIPAQAGTQRLCFCLYLSAPSHCTIPASLTDSLRLCRRAGDNPPFVRVIVRITPKNEMDSGFHASHGRGMTS